MELATKYEPCYVIHPHTVMQEYGQPLDNLNMDEMYDELITNPKIKKRKINARHLLVKIAQTQKESGYPYIFFKENANKQHALNRSEEHTSELQSLMRISYAVFCLKKKNHDTTQKSKTHTHQRRSKSCQTTRSKKTLTT